ncbi:MAG: serine dehydratase subunit alpha family protein [Bacteroidales bacterium]|nr:serine dehydratase subunit alpha family protein [Bacteroidales bacterium]
MTAREAEIIELIRKEVKPALGCTEPIAVALAAAKVMEIIEENEAYPSISWRCKREFVIKVEVSGNILKNGMGVGIPGTGMVGLHIAAALGAVCGRSCYGLEVLNDLDDKAVSLARLMVKEKAVTIGVTADTSHKLYVKATVETLNGHRAEAIIMDDHDRIVSTSLDGNVLTSDEVPAEDECNNAKSTLDYHLTVKEIFDFASSVAFEEIEFILESRTLNLALAQEGLKGHYGLKVGYSICQKENAEVFGQDFLSYAMSLTAAASDARMAGCTLAAMSNSGSGNQGITVTMPVIAYSIRYGTSDEHLARALVLSHLIAIHIKGYLGKLSALCGCVIASTGASCGLVYLRGGDYGQVCSAIKNMIGNITGMVCDGAKVGCAMKVASGVSGALQSAVLAREGICISEHDGIIEKDIEKTIQNLGRIGSVGMQNTDNMILDIMVCK